MIVLSDPGKQMDELTNIFASRRILIDKLLTNNAISINITELIHVLEKLKNLDQNILEECFALQPQEWIQFASQRYNKAESSLSQLSQAIIKDIHYQNTKNLNSKIELDVMLQISQVLSTQSSLYSHCPYQSCVAASVLSQHSNFVICSVPTGSGKTWIQGLIAKYLILQGKRVTIIEPNELLRDQTMEMLGIVGYELTVISQREFYEYQYQADLIILNEYDYFIYDNPYMIINSFINGVWCLKDKKIFAFTATSSFALEKFVNNIITRPEILAFKSQYEIMESVSPVSNGNIIPSKDANQALQKLLADLPKQYETKPIIIVVDEVYEKKIITFVQSKKWRFKQGATLQNLKEIRQWDYGLLIIKPEEARGVDTRFQKDSVVLICCETLDQNSYLQILGRSSRSRNICEGTLYLTYDEKPSVAFEKIMNQNYSKLQSLEHLIKIISQKQVPKYLVEVLQENIKKGKMIKTIEGLKKEISENRYLSLMKSASS